MATVVLDPGHGGWRNTGGSSWNNAVGPAGTLEKTLTLDIARRAAARLRAAGHAVTLTRDDDVNLSLADRAAVARRLQAEVFVSVHFNGSTGHNAQGTETLVHTNHAVASARLSLAVQDALLPVTKLTDRNKAYDPRTRIKPQALGVLNPANHHNGTAGCLLEVSFLDRADEEQRLAAEAYRDAIGHALQQGIVAFLASRAAAPVAATADLEDAIEVAAAEAGMDTARFLALDTPAKSLPTAAPASDAGEFVAGPANPFSDAFLSGAPGSVPVPAAPTGEEDYHAAFARLILNLGLRHFDPEEFLFLGHSNASGGCAGKNALPPRDLWPNITATARMIDLIRARLGAPIRILSGYRSAAYNACVKGESNSLHTRFRALDFTCAAGTPEVWRRVAAEVRASDPAFRGGIGTYVSRRFLHIDTRGQDADWGQA